MIMVKIVTGDNTIVISLKQGITIFLDESA